MMVRKIIEEDLPNHEKLSRNSDIYDWIAGFAGKKRRSARAWSYDWSSSSGACPTIIEFFHLIHIIGGKRFYNLLRFSDPDISQKMNP